MAAKTTVTQSKAAPPGRRSTARRTAPPSPARRGLPRWAWGVIAAVVVIGALYAVFRSSNNTGGPASGRSAYQVGSPGIGQPAPNFTLPSSSGGTVSLAGLRGQTVLLYFQEGVGCEPCWKQMQDLERQSVAVRAVGIDKVVSITTQPVNLLSQKARDEGITTPVLADTSLAVSKSYDANKYGMMGDGMDGHTFVLVGPDGTIQWRADYGGAPKYTMYVPVHQLLADVKGGRQAA